MMYESFLRIKKLKGAGIIGIAARHNKRASQSEIGASFHIDASRTVENEVIRGPLTPREVFELAKLLMHENGVGKLRKDAVLCLEIVFSLPRNHQVNDRAFFSDCADWVVSHFGGYVLSADIHRDESMPHCHVLLLPLIDGRMVGGRLMGNKRNLQATHESFYDHVAKRYGFRRKQSRLKGSMKLQASELVISHLRSHQDHALGSAVWAVIRDHIESSPTDYLELLGIELPVDRSKRMRLMCEIFTSKGKGVGSERSDCYSV